LPEQPLSQQVDQFTVAETTMAAIAAMLRRGPDTLS
jgi:hypothetical protein